MRYLTFLAAVSFCLTSIAGEPTKRSVNIELGPKAYRDGDVIRILSVSSTSRQLEQGDTVTVKGKVRLDSIAKANLSLLLTQTESDGSEETDASQTVAIKNGLTDFSLTTTIKHRGVLHLTFYDIKSGRPFGGVYFGTAKQMQAISGWDLSYYLRN